MRRISSLIPTGLRWRLTAWVAGVMLVSAAAVFVVVYTDTGTQISSQIDREISGDLGQLAQALRPASGQAPAAIAGTARSYLGAQPYTASSTLLFTLVPNAQTASNHPEVFGGGPEPGESLAEQQDENRAGQRLQQPHLGYSVAHVPDVGRMRLLERAINLGGVRVVVAAGEPLNLVESAQHGVARAFLLAGIIVLALALLASYIAGARVSAPLRRMAGVAARVDAGDLAPRMELSGGSADEVRVLGESFNHMLDRLAEAFASQREFVADASHELRTPLTVIRGQLEVLAAQPEPSEEEVRRVERLVQAEIGRISRLVDDLLVLAQAERTDFLRPEPVDLRSFVAELWDGLSLTAERRFELGPVPNGRLTADPDRLAQALRNLARNAIEHTADGDGLVRLEVDQLANRRLRFTVIDDGPGIPPDQRERIFERFHRVDSARSRKAGGAGLGLAIVRAVAEAHGGHVKASSREDARGAQIELVLPGFIPEPGNGGPSERAVAGQGEVGRGHA
ncbi:MAG TPA: HAMP domain-containing sensor histidine kinase [Solirubrobacteraceae bacterium]|nr:HAMP domain-containing sensor histidine kinase [Solirubrobacteraceae bacterium]